jgi:hypothetical protein
MRRQPTDWHVGGCHFFTAWSDRAFLREDGKRFAPSCSGVPLCLLVLLLFVASSSSPLLVFAFVPRFARSCLRFLSLHDCRFTRAWSFS